MADLHSADWLVPVVGDPIPNGALLEADGVITAVGRRADLRKLDHDHEQHWDGVIIPGLVNAHTHLQYSHMAAVGSRRYADFPEWVTHFQAAFAEPGHDWYAAALEGARQAIATGTTAIADVVTNPEALPVLRNIGVKGIAYWEFLSWANARSPESARTHAEKMIKEHQDLPIGLSPHAPHTLDEDVLVELTDIGHEFGLRRHVHVAESLSEVEFIGSGSGPHDQALRQWGIDDFALQRRQGSGLRPVDYLDRLVRLGPDCHIAHGIYTDADDRAVLRRRRTVVALCPRSNATISLDEAPVADYLREGNLVAVGTDSLASTPSLDLLADLAELAAIAARQGYRESDLDNRLLEAATLGGSKAMGLDQTANPVGALASGWSADFAVVAVNEPRQVVYEGAGQVTATVIDGSVRHRATSR
ncbi:MAG TPA: amidohydrolase family protein [Kribbella sp.]